MQQKATPKKPKDDLDSDRDTDGEEKQVQVIIIDIDFFMHRLLRFWTKRERKFNRKRPRVQRKNAGEG